VSGSGKIGIAGAQIVDQDQNLDQSLKTEAIPSDPSGHSPLPGILRSQAAKHLAALSGSTQLTTSDGRIG
jgi:hypothetical protein